MCVIAYMKPGVKISDETIKTMFDVNPDGAGIMYKLTPNSPVEINKGFYTVKSLLKAFHKIPDTAERAIHCRIATTGGKACVHPFPVANEYKPMLSKKFSCNMAVAHNGVISFCTPKGGLKADHSDTMEFVKDYICPLQGQLDIPQVKALVEEATPSRFLIFRQGKESLLWGDWVEDAGVYYSNETYKPYYDRYSKYYSSCYDWGDIAWSDKKSKGKKQAVKKEPEPRYVTLSIPKDYGIDDEGPFNSYGLEEYVMDMLECDYGIAVLDVYCDLVRREATVAYVCDCDNMFIVGDELEEGFFVTQAD